MAKFIGKWKGESSAFKNYDNFSKASAPGTPPKNGRAISLSPSTALVKWDEPARPNGIIKGYKIFYTIEPDIPVVLWTTLDIPIPQANERQATITELKTSVYWPTPS
ncbi:receptor-type tyrosine-protein phosphatase F-like [Mytilus edulis]|uniref:receptor-type tyrosine-protein phosphatase F-like n=1 Tax=Mytilus edulis TaxID=6550 RepID=UPI0039EEE7A1